MFIEYDEDMHTKYSHSVREIHYHSFGSKNMYLFAVLHSRHVQIFKQIDDAAGNIRFKKVIVPALIGKTVQVDYHEY
jgi:hypothetical protein